MDTLSWEAKLFCPVSEKRSRLVGRWEGVVNLASPGRPTDTGLQLGKACYPCSR